MTKNDTGSRLTLSRETLRNLTLDELRLVAGGGRENTTHRFNGCSSRS